MLAKFTIEYIDPFNARIAKFKLELAAVREELKSY